MPCTATRSPGQRAAVPQCVVGGDSGAEQRRCFDIAETFRYRRQRFHRSQHVLLVSAVIADAGNLKILAIAKISAPARAARVVLPAMPADAHPLSLLPCGNPGAHFIDHARDFVSWNAGILESPATGLLS